MQRCHRHLLVGKTVMLRLVFVSVVFAALGIAQVPVPGGGGSGSASGGTCAVLAGDVTGTCAANSIKTSVGLTGSPTTTTQSQNDNSTKIATTAYTDLAVANAVSGINPAVAVLAASTATLTGTYSNGTSGVGATFTVTATGTFSLDGIAINTIGQRVLLKNQSTAFQNGIYTATVVGASLVSPVFTRALDYNSPSNINSTGAIPVQSGTVNATTSWLLTSTVITVGTDALTYSQFSISPTTGVPVLISTSGPVADTGVPYSFQFNNASGALTFNAPSGVAGYQRCYKNATGKSGAITVQMATSNTVDVGGTNGSSAGTLVSSGAAGDALCMVSDATNHWYAYISSGSWTNN